MEPKICFILAAFLLSLISGWYVIPRIVLISKRKRLFDKLDARKEAKPPIPRLGGLAFFPISIFSFAFMLGMRYLMDYNVPETMEANLLLTFMFVTAGLVLIFFIGLADDLVEVSYKTKFLVQIFSASLLMFAGLYITDLGNLLFINKIPNFAGIILTIIFIVFTVNSFNLIDGVNGLCSGMSIISLFAFGGWLMYVENFVYAMLAFSMAGVVLAFFYYNVRGKRLQIFMGDTGSLTLGFIISFLALKFITPSIDHYEGDFYEPHSRLALVFGLLFVPLFDTLRVFITRIKAGLSPFHPDRRHIHHKMLDLGLSHIQSTIVLLTAQIFFLSFNILLGEVLKLDNNIILIADIFIAMLLLSLINKGIKKRKAKIALRLSVKQKLKQK